MWDSEPLSTVLVECGKARFQDIIVHGLGTSEATRDGVGGLKEESIIKKNGRRENEFERTDAEMKGELLQCCR